MSEFINLDHVLSYKEAKDLITICLVNQEPIMLHGGPGIGKSDLVHEIAKGLNRELIDIRAGLFSEVDVKGYPYICQETKTMKFALANEFPQNPNSTAIIFLDEINAAPPSTQLALYQLILNRRIGEYILPKGVAIIAAGNRESDRAGIFGMPLPLQNRFAHVELEVNFDQWLEYAISNSVDKDVISYLLKNPSKLNTFNPEISNRGFETPRSWIKASKLKKSIKNPGTNIVFNVMASCVGKGTASEFMGFLKIIDKLPDPMDILSGKQKTLEDLETCLQYAVVTNLLYKLRELHNEDPEDTKWNEYANNFFEFMINNGDTIGVEFIAMSCTVGYNVYKLPFNAKRTPSIMKAMSKFGSLIDGL